MRAAAIAVILAVILLTLAPVIGLAGSPLAPWPSDTPLPKIHLDCKSQRTVVAIKIELAGRITNEYLIDCTPA